jgi:hypothetical protein
MLLLARNPDLDIRTSPAVGVNKLAPKPTFQVQCVVSWDCGYDCFYDCVANTCISNWNPRFTLEWTGDYDYDLHVMTPGGFNISWRYEWDPISNGRLERDIVPRTVGSWAENIFFPLNGTAPVGIYTFNVQGGPGLESWQLTVWLGDSNVASYSGVGRSSSYQYSYHDGSTDLSCLPVLP